ncbi:MAG: twin transmembrane helix small protein [Rhizobiaceae bacterium]|nr:MAG: twin transmembrane helix small protein [Rhizobiaceae bacterium]
MTVFIEILAVVAIATVVIVLVSGLINMAQGGPPNRSNQLMQARVMFQFIAIVLVLLAVFLFRK